MCPPSRYIASISSVNKIRLRKSGIRKMFAAASKNFIFDYPLQLASNHCSASPGLLDLLQSRFREHMRRYRDLARKIARSQHLQPGAQLLDNAQLQQPARIELVAFQLLQPAHIYDGVFFPEYVIE